MQRFLILIWNDQRPDQSSLAQRWVQRIETTFPDWLCALDASGLTVYHTGARPPASNVYILPQDGGVILGTLFARHADPGTKSFEVDVTERETRELRLTAGRHLFDRYWGRYVAVLRDVEERRIHIIRDPTGAIPCLLTKHQGVYVACSHIEDCVDAISLNPLVDLEHVAAYLWHHRLVTKRTGLHHVEQVLAGECVTVEDGESSTGTFSWHPRQVYLRRMLENREEAMREVRTTVQLCVSAWGSLYRRVLHQLSGGLDSAIVLASLSMAPRNCRVVCQTYFTERCHGDERAFARTAANRAGVALIESPLHGAETALGGLFRSERLISPTLSYMLSESKAAREALVESQGIQAVFSGQGGDHFSQQAKTSLVAADFAWNHGLKPGLLQVIADTARLTRLPPRSVLAAALSSGLLRQPRDPYNQLRPPMLISAELRNALCSQLIRHPWLDDLAHLPSGKLLQVFHIIDSQNLYQEPADYADIVHPLVSQPIIELCLQIPSYVLTYRGIERALLRDAFAADLPIEITCRRTKGTTNNYFASLLIGNLAFLRERLLDGHLAANHVLDRSTVEASLKESELTRNMHLLFPVLNAIKAELWLHNWKLAGARSAA